MTTGPAEGRGIVAPDDPGLDLGDRAALAAELQPRLAELPADACQLWTRLTTSLDHA